MQKIEKTDGGFENTVSTPHHDLSVKSFMDILRTIPKYDKLDFGYSVVVYRGYDDFILEYKKKSAATAADFSVSYRLTPAFCNNYSACS